MGKATKAYRIRINGRINDIAFVWKILATLVLVVIVLFLLNSCAAGRVSHGGIAANVALSGNTATQRLAMDLALLQGYRDDETPLLAKTILSATAILAREYQVQPPALWHNFLVNAGVRDRGLCCHWTQDLLREIEALQLKKYRAVWAVSRHGTWREHSSIVITAIGQGFENGLVLDAWRNAGKLYWARVTEDFYAWQPHPGANGLARIRCR